MEWITEAFERKGFYVGALVLTAGPLTPRFAPGRRPLRLKRGDLDIDSADTLSKPGADA